MIKARNGLLFATCLLWATASFTYANKTKEKQKDNPNAPTTSTAILGENNKPIKNSSSTK